MVRVITDLPTQALAEEFAEFVLVNLGYTATIEETK